MKSILPSKMMNPFRCGWECAELDETQIFIEEDDKYNKPIKGVLVLECDYDIKAHALYASLEQRDWKLASEILRDKEGSAGSYSLIDPSRVPEMSPSKLFSMTWVFSRDEIGKILWRMLPIHAAIKFKAPTPVLMKILENFPEGSRLKDSNGNLPLHLAFRYGLDQRKVTKILKAHPDAVDIENNQKLIPVECIGTTDESAEKSEDEDSDSDSDSDTDQERDEREIGSSRSRVRSPRDSPTQKDEKLNDKNTWKIQVLEAKTNQLKEREKSRTKEVEDLKHKLLSKEKECASLIKATEDLKSNHASEITSLKQQLEATENGAGESSLREDLSEKTKQYHGVCKEMDNLQSTHDKELRYLEKQLADSRIEIENLEGELSRKEKQYPGTQNSKNNLEQTSIETLEKKHKREIAQIKNDFAADLSRWESQYQDKIKKLEAEREKALKDLEQKAIEAMDATSKFNKASIDLDDKDKTVKRLRELVAKNTGRLISPTLSANSTEEHRMRKELESLRDLEKKERMEIAKLLSELEKVSGAMTSMEKRHKQEVDALKNDIDALTIKDGNGTVQKDSEIVEKSKLQREIAELKENEEKDRKKIRRLKDELSELESDYAKLEKKYKKRGRV